MYFWAFFDSDSKTLLREKCVLMLLFFEKMMIKRMQRVIMKVQSSINRPLGLFVFNKSPGYARGFFLFKSKTYHI